MRKTFTDISMRVLVTNIKSQLSKIVLKKHKIEIGNPFHMWYDELLLSSARVMIKVRKFLNGKGEY